MSRSLESTFIKEEPQENQECSVYKEESKQEQVFVCNSSTSNEVLGKKLMCDSQSSTSMEQPKKKRLCVSKRIASKEESKDIQMFKSKPSTLKGKSKKQKMVVSKITSLTKKHGDCVIEPSTSKGESNEKQVFGPKPEISEEVSKQKQVFVPKPSTSMEASKENEACAPDPSTFKAKSKRKQVVLSKTKLSTSRRASKKRVSQSSTSKKKLIEKQVCESKPSTSKMPDQSIFLTTKPTHAFPVKKFRDIRPKPEVVIIDGTSITNNKPGSNEYTGTSIVQKKTGKEKHLQQLMKNETDQQTDPLNLTFKEFGLNAGLPFVVVGPTRTQLFFSDTNSLNKYMQEKFNIYVKVILKTVPSDGLTHLEKKPIKPKQLPRNAKIFKQPAATEFSDIYKQAFGEIKSETSNAHGFQLVFETNVAGPNCPPRIRQFPIYKLLPKSRTVFHPSSVTNKDVALATASPPLPVISNVQSLAKNNGNSSQRPARNKTSTGNQPILNSNANVEPKMTIKHHIIIKPAAGPELRNAATMCKLKQNHKGINAKPMTTDKAIQTDEREAQKVLIPVPVPIFIPSPLPMYSVPAPYPLPFPLPIPVPIFIPTTRNSAKGIMKEIKKIQVKIPTDPYEAELLMMAEMVAGDKKEENTDSESDVEDATAGDEGTFSPEPVDASNTFGDDMLQMALKMATELEEPAVDLEGALTANTITAPQGSEAASEEAVDDPQGVMQMAERQSFRGRKRGSRGAKASPGGKRRRMSAQPVEMPAVPSQPAIPQEPAEKPDAHLCLKYTFGVNAWKQWVTTKNTELEKSSKFPKLFKTEILQLTADELNYSLCLFVKEVRKPNGAEYAPDTIYYLCLGIQQYLFENGRIDNIFCDPYYETFTDSLDEVARKFSVLYNDSHYIVTRVEEEHLWESKQLGAHSPHVLLSTLMFFNTKHFNLTTVQEHMQLSFSHIMKHWKRNPNQAGVARVPGSRNVLLRFYPPQAAMQNNTRKKKVYEQQENDENPLRCPVKLYEFYLSKCPESVKTRNDVFYLQPERSCVPDSPVWYSTTALPQEALEKMLHRVKMVKEINVALLTS